MIDKFIGIIVNWIVKSDTRFLLEKIKEKDSEWLTEWLQARKVVLNNE